MNSSKKTIYILFISALIITIGVTYAYFSVVLETRNQTNNIVSTGKLTLNYIDGQEISILNARPGDHIEKTFIVQNTGNFNAFFEIGFKNYINTIEREELFARYTCRSFSHYEGTNNPNNVESGYCDNLLPKPLSIVSAPLKSNIFIPEGFTYVYDLVVEFKETSSAQDYNQGHSFSATIQINDSYDINYDGGALALYVNNEEVASLSTTTKYFLDSYTCYNKDTNQIVDNSHVEWNSETMSMTVTPITDTVYCNLYLTKDDGTIEEWQYMLELAGINYNSYASLNAFMADTAALQNLANNKNAMHYLITQSSLISSIKSTANYSTNYSYLLNGTGITNEEKYNVGLPNYMYNLGESYKETGFPLSYYGYKTENRFYAKSMTASGALVYSENHIKLLVAYENSYSVYYSSSNDFDASKYNFIKMEYKYAILASNSLTCTYNLGTYYNSGYAIPISNSRIINNDFDVKSSSTFASPYLTYNNATLTTNISSINTNTNIKITINHNGEVETNTCNAEIYKLYAY